MHGQKNDRRLSRREALACFWAIPLVVSIQQKDDSKSVGSAQTVQSQEKLSLANEKVSKDIAVKVYGDDTSESLFAKWIECKLKCNRSTENGQLALKHEFTGFFSGRINAPIPKWWRNYILSMDTGDGIQLPKPMDDQEGVTTRFGISYPSKVTLREFNNEFASGSFDKDEFRLKWAREGREWLLDDGLKPSQVQTFFVIEKLIDGGYVFAVSNEFCMDHDIIRTTPEGEVVWRAQIDNLMYEPMIELEVDPWNGRMEITVDKDSVTVFGVSSACIYADSFDLESGKPQFRFNTLRGDKVIQPVAD